jgi:hypothetical protein
MNQSWVLHHDNAPAHSPFLVRNFLNKNETTAVPQPLYLPDLAPADIFLFPKLKPTLKGRFDTFDEIQKHSTKEFFAIPKLVFQRWQKSWERRVASEGNYFEKETTLKATNLNKLYLSTYSFYYNSPGFY